VSAASAEPVEAEQARAALLAALRAADGPLADACAALDPGQAQRLRIALSASEPGVKTCLAMARGLSHCGNPALVRCVEGWLGRGRCSDAP
jgi:hypothetical protein